MELRVEFIWQNLTDRVVLLTGNRDDVERACNDIYKGHKPIKAAINNKMVVII